MSQDAMIDAGMNADFGSAVAQTAGLARGLISRAARRSGGVSSPSAAPVKPFDFLRQLLPHVEAGLSFDAAVKRISPRPGARKQLARLLTRIPKRWRKGKLTSAGKLRHLLALPEQRLAPRRKPRKNWRRAAAAQRRLNRLSPAARLQLLNAYATLREGGTRGRLAARQAGASVPTLWRWHRRYAQAGLAGLETRFKSVHRPSRLDKLGVVVPEQTLACVRRLSVERGGNLRAWRAYLASPECPPNLRAALQGRAVPESLRRATRLTRSKVILHVGPGLLAVGPLPGRPGKFHFLTP